MTVIMKPTSVIKARLGIEPNGRVQSFFTETCYNHMDKYVPFKEGDLASNVSLKPNSITYESPHAHYMYEGILYVDSETGSSWARKDTKKVPASPQKELKYNPFYHPLASSHWDRQMVSAEMEDVVKEVQEHINRGGK